MGGLSCVVFGRWHNRSTTHSLRCTAVSMPVEVSPAAASWLPTCASRIARAHQPELAPLLDQHSCRPSLQAPSLSRATLGQLLPVYKPVGVQAKRSFLKEVPRNGSSNSRCPVRRNLRDGFALDTSCQAWRIIRRAKEEGMDADRKEDSLSGAKCARHSKTSSTASLQLQVRFHTLR